MPIANPAIRITSRPSRPSLSGTPAIPDAIPVANGFTVEPRPRSRSRAGRPPPRRAVVAGRDHHRDHERIERQALLGHSVLVPPSANTHISTGIIHRSPPRIRSTRLPMHRLDRPGLHRHPEEPADHDDEQRDVDRTEQRPLVVVVDVPLGVLDPVQAVDRRRERVGRRSSRASRPPRGRSRVPAPPRR